MVLPLSFLSKTHKEVIFLLFIIDKAFAAKSFFSTLTGFLVITLLTFVSSKSGFFWLNLLIWPSVIIPVVCLFLFWTINTPKNANKIPNIVITGNLLLKINISTIRVKRGAVVPNKVALEIVVILSNQMN